MTRRSAVASPWEQYIHCTRAVGAGGPRGHCPPPVFSRSVNPISAREGGRLCPPRYYVPPSWFLDLPTALCTHCATTYTAFDLQYGKDLLCVKCKNKIEGTPILKLAMVKKIYRKIKIRWKIRQKIRQENSSKNSSKNVTMIQIQNLICTKFSIFCASPIARLNCTKK